MQPSIIVPRHSSFRPPAPRGRSFVSAAFVGFLLAASLLAFQAGAQIFTGTFPYVPETYPPQPPTPDHVLEINVPRDGDLQLTVTTSATLGFHMATMGLFDRDRTTRIALLSSGFGTTEIRTFYGLRAGTYYLIFHPSSLSYGDYVIGATPLPNPILNDQEPNDSLALAQPAGLDERCFGHIGYSWQQAPYDRYDYWKFVLPVDGELDNLFEVAFNYLNAAVLCEDGTLVMAGGLVEAGGKDLLKFDPPHLVAGTYYLRLQPGYAGVSFGGYAFKLMPRPAAFGQAPAKNDTPQSAVPVAMRSAGEGHLGYVGGAEGSFSNDLTDWWSFEHAATGDLQVECQTTAHLPFIIDILRKGTEQRVFGGSLDEGKTGTLLVKNLPAGSYLLNVRCYRWNWGSYSFRLIPVTQPSLWNRWLEQHFTPAEIAAGQLAAPTADPDGDQEVNLMEFALGHNPQKHDSAASSPLAPRRVTDPAGRSHLALVFERPNDRLNALRYLAWYSDTLKPPNWQPLLASETVSALEGNRETVRFVDPTAYDTQPTRYYRLSVELKP